MTGNIVFAQNNITGNTLSFSTQTGYLSNVYKDELNAKSSYPLSLKTDFNYCYRYNSHCFGGNGSGNYKYYLNENNQNSFLYTVSPYYLLVEDKKTEIKLSYEIFQEGTASINKERKYRHLKGKDIRANITLNPYESGLFLEFLFFQKEYENSIEELDYLDSKTLSFHSVLKFFYYPESAITSFLEYLSTGFNQSPSENQVEKDFKLLKAGLGWETTITNNVYLKVLIFEKIYKYIGNISRLSTNLEFFVENKLSPTIDLYTGFDLLTETHRSLDALNKSTKALVFGTKFIVDPTINGRADVNYKLVSYSKPHRRSELNFFINTELNKRLSANYVLYSTYRFDFVLSDNVGLDEYGEEVLTRYNAHEILIGLKCSL